MGFLVFILYGGKTVDSGNPKELFFHTLLDTIKKQYNVTYLISINPWRSVLKKRNDLRKFVKSKKTIFLDNHISFKNLLNIYRLSFPTRFIKVISLISKEINLIKFNKIDITGVILDELMHSFKNPVTLQAYLLDCAIRKLEMKSFHIYFLD